jgi:arginyl-tRNA synthetase
MTRLAKYNFSKMIYVVGADQSLHFQKLFALLDLAGHADIAARCQHIGFGKIGGMSTRAGNVVLVKDILSEAKKRNLRQMESNTEKFKLLQDPDHVAEVISIAAVVVQDLNAGRERDFTWNWDRVLVPYGRTGPGLIYCIVRLESIAREVHEKWGWNEYYQNFNAAQLKDADTLLSIGFHLSMWPDTIKNAYTQLEPSIITKYLLDLVQLVNDAYQKHRVITSDPETARTLLTVFWAAKVILKKGAELLGLSTLTRM